MSSVVHPFFPAPVLGLYGSLLPESAELMPTFECVLPNFSLKCKHVVYLS